MSPNDTRTAPPEYHRSNAAAWNQTAEWYQQRVADARPLLRNGGTTLHRVELQLLESLGPLADWCDVALHLQCAAGLDANSLCNLGAQSVIGVDIATDLIDIARQLSHELSTPARFLTADVLDIPPELDQVADLVYTGKGALHWMFDLKGWSKAVTRVLKPGGTFLCFDFHPMMWLFRADEPELVASGISYFAPIIRYREWPAGHIGALTVPHDELIMKRIRPWPPSAVIQAVLDAGLVLEQFAEYPDTLAYHWSAYPSLSDQDRRKVATTYSIIARKPR